jgi:phosphotransferase family enzyme
MESRTGLPAQPDRAFRAEWDRRPSSRYCRLRVVRDVSEPALPPVPLTQRREAVEIPLVGGDVTEGVVRVGDTVRRPRGPWSGSIACYLRHLEAVGFEEAPRYLGIDAEGRDILAFVAGDVPSQPVVEAWVGTREVLVAVASLLRRLHDASASFVAPPDAVWFGDDIQVALPDDVPPEPPGELITHSDVTPQNVVFRNGVPVALIDFDLTRPGTRLRDVVNTAMWWVPLMPVRDRDPAFASSAVAQRLAAFADAYKLDATGRSEFVDVAIVGATRTWHRMRANAELRGGGWVRMWAEGVGDRILRRRSWLVSNRELLTSVLTDG